MKTLGFYAIYIAGFGLLAHSAGRVLTKNTYQEAVDCIGINSHWQGAMVIWVEQINTKDLRVAFIKDGKWEAIYYGTFDPGQEFVRSVTTPKGATVSTSFLPDYS